MEVNLPGLLNTALPDRARNGDQAVGMVNLLNNAPSHNDSGFLSRSFPRNPPKLYVTAETDDFDALTLQEWGDEGFRVEYLPMGRNLKQYRARLGTLSQGADLGPCETYGVISYGDAASVCLEHFHVVANNESLKLGCLIAYYPSRIPDPRTRFPSGVHVLVHLTQGDEVGVVKQSQMLGVQGKKRVSRQSVGRGVGLGGLMMGFGYPAYAYDADAGFAENDMEAYDSVSADLAWSRSLEAARWAFKQDVSFESLVEQHNEAKFFSRDLDKTMQAYAPDAHVTHIPTLTGGIGSRDLERFYDLFFLDSNPPSLRFTLLSRTSGANRVVDELHVSFRHTHEMPWILPGIPPTNRHVEVVMVSIVALRAAKLCHEHVYWDQASVLVQTGLLNPKLAVPERMRQKGVESLPVVSRDAARRMIGGFYKGEEGEADNSLVPGWDDDDVDEEEEQHDSAHHQDAGAIDGEADGIADGDIMSNNAHAEDGQHGNLGNNESEIEGNNQDDSQVDDQSINGQSNGSRRDNKTKKKRKKRPLSQNGEDRGTPTYRHPTVADEEEGDNTS